MKNTITLFIIGIIFSGCNSSKNVVVEEEDIETPTVVTETVVVIPKIQNSPVQKDTEVDIIIIEEPEVDEESQIIEESESFEDITEVQVPITFDHGLFDTLLKKHVDSEGVVNYAGFKNNWSSLRAYIASLGTQLPTDEWSENEKLAYWMNAYNAMTIDLILRNQPLESIKDIKDPWGQRLWKLGDKWYNLNQIEHQILRKMGDARIHFGINCASFSCPPLLNKAFTAQNVDTELDRVAQAFINDPLRNTINTNAVEISKIFDWFKKDFKTEGSVIDYLNRYATTRIAPDAKIRYKDYNWELND